VAFFGQLRQTCRDPPLPQDDIWGWEDYTAAQDDTPDGRGRLSSILGVTWGG